MKSKNGAMAKPSELLLPFKGANLRKIIGKKKFQKENQPADFLEDIAF